MPRVFKKGDIVRVADPDPDEWMHYGRKVEVVFDDLVQMGSHWLVAVRVEDPKFKGPFHLFFRPEQLLHWNGLDELVKATESL